MEEPEKEARRKELVKQGAGEAEGKSRGVASRGPSNWGEMLMARPIGHNWGFGG